MSKDRKSLSDWWTEHLAEYYADGINDATSGTYNQPWPSEDDDPQNQDENDAYRRGFTARRKELGDAFKWATSVPPPAPADTPATE